MGMQSKTNMVIAWALLLAILLAPMAGIAAKADIALQQKLARLQERIAIITQSLQRAEGEKAEALTALRETETEIGHVSRRIHTIHNHLMRQQDRLQALKYEEGVRRAELARARYALTRLLRSAWKIERHGDIRMLLNQQDPALFSRMLTYYRYLSQQRVTQAKQVNEKLAALDNTRQALAEQTKSLAQSQGKQERELVILQELRDTRADVLGAISTYIDDKEKDIAQLKKDEEALIALLQSLTEYESLVDIPPNSGQTPFASLRGKLAWPNDGRLLVQYGSARGNSGLPWSGVIIAARRGEQVAAVAAGRVALSEWLRGYGLVLIIDHGDSYISLYGHNESVYKDTGEWVEAGDVVASVGDSGGQRQSGLYFEIRKGGKPLNPSHWCTLRHTAQR